MMVILVLTFLFLFTPPSSPFFCQMNSMLQALFLLPKFREVVYSIPSEIDDKGAKIGFALQRLFFALQSGSKGVSTKQLTASFGWNSVDAFQQHDVQEFSRVLLDSLDTTTRKTPLGPMIHDLFAIKSQSVIKCMNVDFTSRTPATDWDLALVVKGCKTLSDSFKQYLEVEVLDGDNMYRAEGHGKQAAKKGIQFLSLPPILQLQLRRFEYDPMRDQMMKINDRFEYPTEIDLTPFISDANGEPIKPSEPELYVLHSVLVHSGGVHGGHYYSYIRPFMRSVPYDEANWYKFDDDHVTKVSEEDAVSGNYGGADTKYKVGMWGGVGGPQARVSTTSAYMLIYIRKSAIQTLIAPQTGLLPVENQQPAVTEKNVEEGAVAKKDAKDDDKKDDIPVQYLVDIPDS